MLNTRKLLYILPDVAYVAELLPTKKEHTFSIQSFRQINGDFLTEDDDLIADNIDKLFSKLDPDTYHLVLPDFLFTNTILEIKETQESKVKEYIKETLLPDLELTKETHEISTFVLTQYGNTTKIQLTALEKSVLDPMVVASQDHKVVIEHISPLSWTIKSIISLEPSISVIQIGSIVYVAEHYIGVDQCTMSSIDEVENVEETIKTLKGAQPSIQTIYLLTNSLVEEKLKEKVSKTLPIQQLAVFKEEESQMPSYVKHIIESGMKTLDIADFPVPLFNLPKTVSGVIKAKTKAEKAPEPSMAEAMIEKPRPLNVFETVDEEDVDVEPDDLQLPEAMPLPNPVMPAILPTLESEDDKTEDTESLDTSVADKEEDKPQPLETKPDEVLDMKFSLTEEEKHVTNQAEDQPSSVSSSLKINKSLEITEESNLDEPDLSIFAPASRSEMGQSQSASSPFTKTSNKDSHKEAPMDSSMSESSTTRPIIKNKGGGNLVKGLVVLVATLAITMAIGAGIGLAVLRLTDNSGEQVAVTPSPSPIASTAPSPTPSPSPSPVAIQKDKFSVLVVNATTTPGYAGTTRSKLEAAGFKTVKAANAKGDYEPGTYVLMKTEDKALIAALAKDTGLTLDFAQGIATEDPKAEYSAVIVLAE